VINSGLFLLVGIYHLDAVAFGEEGGVVGRFDEMWSSGQLCELLGDGLPRLLDGAGGGLLRAHWFILCGFNIKP
jgi:hypothetical protein